MYRLHYLGSGEVLPLEACHWVGDNDGLHSGHGVRLHARGFPVFSHNPFLTSESSFYDSLMSLSHVTPKNL